MADVIPLKMARACPTTPERSPCQRCERSSCPDPLDPWSIARDFPDRWRAYLRAHFRNHTQVAAAFEVTERAARKWWEGDGACNGAKVVVALRLHPDTAPAMLLAA